MLFFDMLAICIGYIIILLGAVVLTVAIIWVGLDYIIRRTGHMVEFCKWYMQK